MSAGCLETYSSVDAAPGYQAQSKLVARIALFSVLAFVLLDIAFVRLAHVFEGVFLLLFIGAQFGAPRQTRQDPAWLYLAGAMAVATFVYVLSNFEFPQYAEPYPQMDVLGILFLFFPIAWWLGGRTTNVLKLLALSLLGFSAALVTFGSWQDISAALDGNRVDFGLRNAEHAGVFFGTALIGWASFGPRMLTHSQGMRRVVEATGWAGVLIVLVLGVIVTQTRAVWLGLVATCLVVGGFALLYPRGRPRYRLMLGLVGTIAIFATALSMSGVANIVGTRLSAETKIIDKIGDTNVGDLPYTSISIRLKLWHEAWGWIKERPVTGWGYRAKKSVIDVSPRFPEWFKKTFGHLHNSIIGIWVAFGLVGLSLVAALAGWIGWVTWKSWRRGTMPTDVFVFGLGFFPFWMVVNQFESYIIWSTGTYLMAVIAGALYTYHVADLQGANAS